MGLSIPRRENSPQFRWTGRGIISSASVMLGKRSTKSKSMTCTYHTGSFREWRYLSFPLFDPHIHFLHHEKHSQLGVHRTVQLQGEGNFPIKIKPSTQ